MNRYSKYVNVDELKKARKNKKMTCEDVSKEMGFKSPVSYYNIEEGIVEPKISQMIKISKILGKSPEKFFNFKLQENWIKEVK